MHPIYPIHLGLNLKGMNIIVNIVFMFCLHSRTVSSVLSDSMYVPINVCHSPVNAFHRKCISTFMYTPRIPQKCSPHKVIFMT